MRVKRIVFGFSLISIMVIGLCVSADLGKINPHKAIVGKWTGFNHGLDEYVTFVFNDGSTGKTMQGSQTLMHFTYKINDKVKPIALDIMVSGHGKALAILEFKSADAMRIKMSFGSGYRAKSFSEGNSNKTVDFKRVK